MYVLGPWTEEKERLRAVLVEAGWEVLLVDDPDRAPPDATVIAGVGRLSLREREVIELLSRGLSRAEVASSLDIEVGTVGEYLRRSQRKTGADSPKQLLRLFSRVAAQGRAPDPGS